MMITRIVIATSALALSAASLAQTPLAAPPAAAPPVALLPLVAAAPAPAGRLILPANTEILLSMNEDITSKKNREGDTFGLSVVHDVKLGERVIIPHGTRAVGEIIWITGKGAFGKSGKMNVELRYIEVGGQRVPVEGKFRQEGEGNTVGTVAGVIVAGVFAAFITGKTAVIPRGRELAVRTTSDLPVVLAAEAMPVAAPAPVPAPAVIPVAATTSPTL